MYIPVLDVYVLSIMKLAENGIIVICKDGRCVIKNRNKVQTLGQVNKHLHKLSNKEKAYFSKNEENNCVYVPHHRFRHRNFYTMDEIFK